MNEWKNQALEMYLKGTNKITEIVDTLELEFDNIGDTRTDRYNNIYEVIRGYRRKKGNKSDEPVADKEPKLTKEDALQNVIPNTVYMNWSGTKTIRFGIVSDTHINSKYTQITYLHRFYDLCESEGITNVYHSGDIDEGEQMRIGHPYECYKQGADEHVDEICRVYPYRKSITTHFITGNHDSSIIKRCGFNIGHAIQYRRDDMFYLGQDCADVLLTDMCKMRLFHPWDGSAYAISYKPQKQIEAIEADSKPNILVTGHYHKAEYLYYRNVHALQAGTFCAQTPFMMGKSLSAHMGGWIIEIDVDNKGYIQRFKSELIPIYAPIKDDYRNWSDFIL